MKLAHYVVSLEVFIRAYHKMYDESISQSPVQKITSSANYETADTLHFTVYLLSRHKYSSSLDPINYYNNTNGQWHCIPSRY